MPRRWTARRVGPAGKALVALIGATGCLAAVAYAATGHAVRRQDLVNPAGPRRLIDPARHLGLAGREAVGGRRQSGRRGAMAAQLGPAAPLLTGHPARSSYSTSAAFRLSRPAAGERLICRLDRRHWRRCRARIRYRDLADGRHRFRVRAVDRRGRVSPATRFAWDVVAPAAFSIAAATAPEPLFPGAAPSQIPLRLTNPNRRAIWVTGVSVEVTASPPGCDAAANLALIPSSASAQAPLWIPAESTVQLPAPGVSAPAIQLRDLPVDQDACRGGGFTLAFHGSAHG